MLSVEDRIRGGSYALQTGLGGVILGQATLGLVASVPLFVLGLIVGWQVSADRQRVKK